MRCPTLAELPPPPLGKTGWPWTIESSELPPTRPDGSAWPRISIITPSYNQGQFIEETLRSVLLQGYPDLEYIVIDGGSTDQSVEIIKKYEPWLTYWVSESDGGQAEAINKGLVLVTGEYINWINSDDSLAVLALEIIALGAGLTDEVDLISGVRILEEPVSGYKLAQNLWVSNWKNYLLGQPNFPQDATFFSRRILKTSTPLDGRLKYSFDVAFYYKALSSAKKIVLTHAIISKMSIYASQKTYKIDSVKLIEQDILNLEYERRRFFWSRVTKTRFHELALHAATFFFRSARRRCFYMDYDVLKGSWQLLSL